MSLQLQPGCFYGTLSKSFVAAGLGLTEIVYPPEHHTPEHSHKRAYFSLSLKGAYTKFYGAQKVECTPQTLIFHPPDQKQSGTCSAAGGRSFLIEIEPQLLERLSRYPVVTDKVTVFREGLSVWFAMRLYREFRQMDELSALTIEGLVLEMMAEAARQHQKSSHRQPPRWLEQTKEILEAQFAENLTLADLAELVGVHPVYLASEFRRVYRLTVGEYIRQLRINFACLQLSTTKCSLAEIALATGFSSQSHFCLTFKRLTGVTPSAYRANFRSP